MGTNTLHEINIRGIEALKNALDPLELVRFFQQYELGSGNYTVERRNKFENYTIDQISAEIKNKKSKQSKGIKSKK
jgi:hypothetical protein